MIVVLTILEQRGDDTVNGSIPVRTEMGCDPALMRQERWVGEMVQARPRLEPSGPTLSLLWGEHWLGLSSDTSR